MAKAQTTMIEAEFFAFIRDHPFDDFINSMKSVKDPKKFIKDSKEVAIETLIELIKDLTPQGREYFLEHVSIAAQIALRMSFIYYESVEVLSTCLLVFGTYWYQCNHFPNGNEFTESRDIALNALLNKNNTVFSEEQEEHDV